MKDRILEFLKTENKTSSQFAEEIGVQASSISHIISGRNKPSLDFIIKMLQQYNDLSTDWLIFGKGEMYKNRLTEDLFTEFDTKSEEQSGDSFLSSMHSEDKVPSQPQPQPSSEPHSQTLLQPQPSPITQVILVYSDNTFRSYNPNKD